MAEPRGPPSPTSSAPRASTRTLEQGGVAGTYAVDVLDTKDERI
jgi:hypothetical protein